MQQLRLLFGLHPCLRLGLGLRLRLPLLQTGDLLGFRLSGQLLLEKGDAAGLGVVPHEATPLH